MALYASVATVSVQAQIVAEQSLFWIGVMHALFGVALVFVRIPIGIAFGKMDQKRLLLFGLLVILFGNSIVLIFAHPVALLLSRLFLGTGAGFWVVSSLWYINNHSENIPKAAAKITLTYGLGIAIGGIGGGFVAEEWGWLAPFWMGTTAALGAIVALIPVQRPKRIPYSFSARRLLALFRDRRFLVISGLGALLFFIGTATVWSFTQNFAHSSLGANRLQLGLVALAMLGPYAVTIGSTHRIRKRIGVEWSITAGLLFAGVATTLIPLGENIPTLLLLQAFVGIGLGVLFSTLMSLSVEGIPLERRGEAMGVFQTIYALGFLFGPLVAGKIAQGLGLEAVFYTTGSLGSFIAFLLLIVLASPLRKSRAFQLST